MLPQARPPIVRYLARPNLVDYVHETLTLRTQNINVSWLRDDFDLFRFVTLSRHCPGYRGHTSSWTT
jgi:hypothetical protein